MIVICGVAFALLFLVAVAIFEDHAPIALLITGVIEFSVVALCGTGWTYTTSVDNIQQLYAGRVQVENALNGAKDIPTQVTLKASPDNKEVIVDAPNALQSQKNTELYQSVLSTVNQYNSILREEKYKRDPSVFVKMMEGFYLPTLPDSLVYMKINFK